MMVGCFQDASGQTGQMGLGNRQATCVRCATQEGGGGWRACGGTCVRGRLQAARLGYSGRKCPGRPPLSPPRSMRQL